MLNKFLCWLMFILGITMIAEPMPSETSVFLAMGFGAAGGLLTLVGIEGIVANSIKERLDDRRGS